MNCLLLDSDNTLSIAECPRPDVGPGQVLVAIRAAALNHRELWIAKGLYPGMTLPCILGADGTGEVVEVGQGCDPIWMNKEVIIYPAYDWGENPELPQRTFRVLGMPDPGTIAQYIAVPQENLIQKPSYLSWEEAAAIPVAYLTAWRALTRQGKVKAGDHVLITGIGGGVAQAGLAFAKSLGAKVFVTSSSSEKIARAKALGAQGGVNYKDEHWPTELKGISKGIDVVLDSSPAANLDDYLKFLNIGARIVAYGSTGSRKTSFNISRFFLKYIQFIGTTMGSPAEFHAMMTFMDEHKIQPMVSSIFPLAKAVQAFEELGKGKQLGKIVINGMG